VHSFVGRFTRGSLGQAPSNAARDWITSDGSHALDLAIATLGLPSQLSVAKRRVGSGPDNAWLIQLSNEQGHAALWLDFAAGRRIERFEWAGPGYDASLELPEKGDFAARQGTESWKSSEVSGSPDFAVNYGFLGEHRAFADAVAGRSPRPEADFAYGERFMRLVRQVLDAPDGPGEVESEKVAVPVGSAATRVTETVTAAAARRRVVAVLQAPDAARRYFSPAELAELSAVCDLRFVAPANSGSVLAEADAVVLGWGAPPLSPAAFGQAQRLQLAVVLGASVKWALPSEALRPGRLSICNTADAIGQSVAEHCLLLTLAGLRRLTEVDSEMHDGGWPPQGGRMASIRKAAMKASRHRMLQPLKPYLKPAAKRVLSAPSNNGGSAWSDLRGQSVGLIGWGHVARRFAELLAPFGCELLIASDHIGGDELQAFRARRASLGEVVAGARVISLHKGLNERTRGMIGADLLTTIPRGAVFVNTARAGLVDEAALVDRARKGDVLFALDVFHEEPLHRRHPLRGMRNVILSPHNASSTPQCARRVGDQALEILRNWMGGGEVAALTERQLEEMT
jgi:phosphoglycerate dehydrogenase-like enzyme